MFVVWIVAAVALLAAAAPLTWDRKPSSREKALDRYARGMNVAITPEVEEIVVARLIRRERSITFGGLSGIAAALAVTPFLPGGFESSVVGIVIFGAFLTGVAIGASVASASASLRSDDVRPRIARASTPEYRDYVVGIERWGVRITVALGVLSVVSAFIAQATGVLGDTALTAKSYLGSGIPTIAAASVVAVIAAEVVARRIIARSQRAASTTELAWDDALRATALRDLVTVPLLLGTAAVFGTFFFVGAKVDPETGGAVVSFVGLAILGALIAVAVALLIWNFTAKPQQHYWRRLWARTAVPTGAGAST